MNIIYLVADGADQSVILFFFRENLTKSNFKAFSSQCES